MNFQLWFQEWISNYHFTTHEWILGSHSHVIFCDFTSEFPIWRFHGWISNLMISQVIFQLWFHEWISNYHFIIVFPLAISRVNFQLPFHESISNYHFTRDTLLHNPKHIITSALTLFFRFTMQDSLESFAYATYLKITIPFVASFLKSYVICILKIKHVWMSIVGLRSGNFDVLYLIMNI